MEKCIFSFDPAKCTACQACVLACMDQNDTDVDHGQRPFRRAAELEWTEEGRARFAFVSVACMHCQDPACISACPNSCLYKDQESGLTLWDNTSCGGCGACAAACPLGALAFNGEGKMEKCDGCVERLRRGLEPACVRVCPTGALTCRPATAEAREEAARSLSLLKDLLAKGI